MDDLLEVEEQDWHAFLGSLVKPSPAQRDLKFNEDQPRDDHGRWTSGGGEGEGNSDYKYPEITHTTGGSNAWGASHNNSQFLTGLSATSMGIHGYDDTAGYEEDRVWGNKAANGFLTRIADDKPGSEEPLYHGFENTERVKWVIGDTVKLPLMATTGGIATAESYGVRLSSESQHGDATIFEFPKGTQMAAYTKNSKREAQDAGYVWSEALVAGGYKVEGLRTYKSEGWQNTGYGEHQTHTHPTVTVVTLRQNDTFDPKSGWTKRG